MSEDQLDELRDVDIRPPVRREKSLVSILFTRQNLCLIAVFVAVGIIIGVLSALVVVGILTKPVTPVDPVPPTNPPASKLGEPHYFSEVKAITSVGVNAEAYWSPDGKKFVFQGILPGYAGCDQIFTMNADGSDIKLASNGIGRTTCAYFLHDDKHIVYSSTMDSLGPGCPPSPDSSAGYVWPVYKSMKLYKADYRTGEIVGVLADTGSYDAEATLSPDGKTIVFTSIRDGDLELYTMDINGTNVKRMTMSPGYDGGAFFSRDGKKIVWRANRPRGPKLVEYLKLLELGLVEPVASDMEIYVMNSDGSGQKKLTSITGANFAPSFLPDNSGIIFASNMGKGNTFHLYTIDLNGKNMRQITTEGMFNLFPIFSPDGQYLAWSSSRDTKTPHAMNVIVAKWIPENGNYQIVTENKTEL